jgi:hypothetical protein
MLLSAKCGKQGDVGLLRVAGSKTHNAGASAKFDFATSRNTDNIYYINRPPQMTFIWGMSI